MSSIEACKLLTDPLGTLPLEHALRSWINTVSSIDHEGVIQASALYLQRCSVSLGNPLRSKSCSLLWTELSVGEIIEKQITKIESSQQIPSYDDSFFVANLSQVEHQHAMWQAHLPCVRPYYGMYEEL